MSISAFSGSQIAVVLQQPTRLPTATSRKKILYCSTSLSSPFLLEVILDFHKHFMEKTNFFLDSENISSEEVLKYLYEYCNELISDLYAYARKANLAANSLPFREMGLFLRTIQSFLLSSTVSNSILKLNREYIGEQRGPNISTFDMSLFMKCFKSGNLEDAAKVFKKHTNYNTPIGAHIESCLNPASRVFGLLYHNENEFLQHFEAVCLESQKLLRLSEKDSEDFKLISRLVSGNLSAFSALSPTWLEYVIYHCLFIEGIVYDAEVLANTLISNFTLSDLDLRLVHIMFGNLHNAVQQASQVYPSFFMCHIIDILTSVSKLPSDSRDEFEGLNYPEFYFYNYVSEIISNTSIPVAVPCDYIFYNLGGLENILEIMNHAALIRLPHENTQEIIKYFQEKNFNQIVQNIHKVKAMESLQANNFGTSLYWAIASNIPELLYKVERHIIDIAAQNPLKLVEEIVSTVPEETRLDSSVIFFFTQFLKFSQLVKAKEVEKAGEMLVSFFANESAPEDFYESLLTQSIKLFESGLVLSYSSFLPVLKAYEKVANKKLRIREPGPGVLEKLSSILAYGASQSLSQRSNDR